MLFRVTPFNIKYVTPYEIEVAAIPLKMFVDTLGMEVKRSAVFLVLKSRVFCDQREIGRAFQLGNSFPLSIIGTCHVVSAE